MSGFSSPPRSSLASFTATMSGNQTGIATATYTKISFNTETFDQGSYYDNATNFRWTPPAGKVLLSFNIITGTGEQANSVTQAQLYKNGSSLCLTNRNDPAVNTSFGLGTTIVDNANGTDYYEVFYFGQSGGTITVNAAGSFFSGTSL